MKILSWIDSLVNRLVTNMTLWIVAGVVVFGIIGYKAYSFVFIRLPEPPVYTDYRVIPPQRKPCTYGYKPAVYAKGEAPQPTPAPQGEAPQAKPGPTVELPPCLEVEAKGDEWTPEQRERYYQTSQGSLVIPYRWFRALESRTDEEMFAAPNVQARYGLLPDNNPKYNKDLMPVGIVKNIVRNEYVETLGEGEKEWASISCAACHTGQLLYRGHAMRIDGGQSFWNFDKWSSDLVFSLMVTSTVPGKFERFCARVNDLPGSAKCTREATSRLRQQIKRYLNSDLVKNAINAILQHTYPATEGPTRTSALGRGVNGIFGPIDKCSGALDRKCERNVNPNTGPVSFPPLWYTHEYDWVQSTTQIRSPLGRNVTEAWGVSAHVELKPGDKQFATTHNIDDMFWMETLLSILQAPRWPEEIFGEIGKEGQIKLDRVERGRILYNDAVWPGALPAEQAELSDKQGKILGPNPNRPKTGYCARCHAPAFEPEGVWPTEASAYGAAAFLQLPLYRQNVMGTDPDDAVQFASRQVYTRDLAPLFANLKPPAANPQLVDIGTTLTVTISGILNRWFTDNNVPESCQKIMMGHRDNLFRAPLGYPARPLDGYWATGPFLHNGSVRTMYELLSPVSERARTFWIGTREFDPVYLGFKNDWIEGAFLYDTSVTGNSNGGHEFRDAQGHTDGVIGPYLTPDDRLAIIEYLKVMRSVQEYLDGYEKTKNRLAQRNALLAAMSIYYEKRFQGSKGADWVEPGNLPESEGGFNRRAFCQDLEKAASQPYAKQSPTPTTTPTATKK